MIVYQRRNVDAGDKPQQPEGRSKQQRHASPSTLTSRAELQASLMLLSPW
jgi:hypothetical protein